MEGASMEQPGWAGGMSLPVEAGCDPQFQEQTGDSQQEQLEQRPPHRRHRAGRLSGSLSQLSAIPNARPPQRRETEMKAQLITSVLRAQPASELLQHCQLPACLWHTGPEIRSLTSL